MSFLAKLAEEDRREVKDWITAELLLAGAFLENNGCRRVWLDGGALDSDCATANGELWLLAC